MTGDATYLFEISGLSGALEGCRLAIDEPPSHELTDKIVEAIGRAAPTAMTVEVGFDELLTYEEAGLAQASWWTASSKDSMSVPLGPRGALDVQSLTFGTGLSHHGLIVGRPGSGKTNLTQIIITGLALKYAPEELELYLVDFKKGVGFKAYADYELPHARVIAIESEREFGISVLRGLDSELARRGELFRAAQGAEKISEYRDRTGERMPRILLIADEYQEFFTSDDSLAREAQLLLDRLIRQGRSFGMHVLLATQTLSGSYGLSASTVNLVAVRIALQCSDSDSRLVLADDNPAARFLTRPGEAIYNDGAGSVANNRQFQVALFDDDHERQFLATIRDRFKTTPRRNPLLVFEGQEPAHLERSAAFASLLAAPPVDKPQKNVHGWLGEPIAIKDATVADFRRQAGSNLLIVTREEAEGLGMVSSVLLSLATEHHAEACQFQIADFSSADLEWNDFLARLRSPDGAGLPHEVVLLHKRGVPDALKLLLQTIDARERSDRAPASNIFLAIAALQRARELRKDEDDYSTDAPGDDLLAVLRRGPDVGVHTVVLADTVASVQRVPSRKSIAEFGLRAVGSMNAADSNALLDNDAASRIDRPHRMLFSDDERPGVIEKFRPFREPDLAWVRQTVDVIRRTRGGEDG